MVGMMSSHGLSDKGGIGLKESKEDKKAPNESLTPCMNKNVTK